MQSLVILLAASAVSASILPRAATNLPASDFPSFDTISLDDAKAGKDLHGILYNATSDAASDGAVTVATAASAACAANPNIRYEWRQYSTASKLAFIGAIKCLMGKPPSGKFPPATNRYEDFVRLHQINMPDVHQNAKFLIWHRYYVWVFQMTLRDECGFSGSFPWWDETLDAGRFGQSELFTSPNYFGHLPGKPSNGQPVCITSGAFAGLTCNIGPGSGNRPHCLSRAGDASATSQCNQAFVNTCNSRSSYADMESCSEYG
jgi:tyrosinase